MATYVRLTIAGSDVTDSKTIQISKSVSDNNSSSSFDISLDNYRGYNKDKYGIGDEVVVYADLGSNPPTTRIFTGILEDQAFTGEGLDEEIKLSGRDYTAYLMDRTVQPEVYTNLQAGSIVKDIVAKYAENVTTSGVIISGTAIPRQAFNHTPVFDAIKKIADVTEFRFWIDENKDIHFVPKSAGSSSGYTFDSGNVTSADFTEKRDTVFNQVWVYGDRYLDGYKETFTVTSGTNMGSEFTLLYKPTSTIVSINSGTSTPLYIQPGGIENMALQGAGSNIRYLVNYDDKKITFVSGTNNGDNIPRVGSVVTVEYQRSLPIVKVGDNETSKENYGTRVKVIVDKDIKDPETALLQMQKELQLNGEPKIEGNLKIYGVSNITPGETCLVNLPYHNINNTTYDILEASYDFNKDNCLSDQVLSIKLNKKMADLTDMIKELLMGQKRIEAGETNPEDLLTRYQTATGSIAVRQSGCMVYTRSIAGETLIYDSASFGIYGQNKYGGGSLTYSFIIGHSQAGVLGISQLGTTVSDWTLQWSGCYLQ